MNPPKSKKGFYLVSPFLGFFFFLISVGIAAFYISENDQQIDTAKAGEEHELAFMSYAIQADVFDVYFQNYLQQMLDNYEIHPQSPPLRTYIMNETSNTLSTSINATYKTLYHDAFTIDCDTSEKSYSLIQVTFTGERQVDILGIGSLNFFSQDGKTAIWPLISQYGLSCAILEPPLMTELDFKSRWYYFDASCICCQSPAACDLGGDAKSRSQCESEGTCKPIRT